MRIYQNSIAKGVREKFFYEMHSRDIEEVIGVPRVDLKKKEYKILDFKGWVTKQMKLTGKKQSDVAEALGISVGMVSIMLKVPDAKDRNKKKKGGKLITDVFSYGQVLTLCELFEVDGKEKEHLLTL